ncbi:MAG: hypothetical protein MK066_14605 [Crocinitomicaceae bacterium]|nr:hypothetical protein [Crocinitomicaceae bacterium]
MKYLFEQFNTELIDPQIIIDRGTVGMNLETGMVAVDITLETPNSKLYGVRLTDMPIYDPELGNNDIEVLVATKLTEYEVTENA